jgi:prepilin-type N-terminal cleavage/methylation domain-containing protein
MAPAPEFPDGREVQFFQFLLQNVRGDNCVYGAIFSPNMKPLGSAESRQLGSCRKIVFLNPRKAFTLIELLVVIAIIAILAAILLQALAGAKRRANQIACISNFKGMGTALRMYVDDANEWLPPGSLPAGMTTGQADQVHIIYFLEQSQKPAYCGTTSSTDWKKKLVYYLATYLSLPAPSSLPKDTDVVVAKAFLCPGYMSTFPANSCHNPPYDPTTDTPVPYANAASYSTTRTNAYPQSLLPGYPFGKEFVSVPLKVTTIAQVAPLTETWACADLDCDCVTDPSGLGQVYANGNVALKPVHGNVRNYLFFDMHVGAKKVATPADY